MTRFAILVFMVLAGCGACRFAVAQTAAGCGAKQVSCVAACRAGLFSIDPRQAECLQACADTAARCARVADGTCPPGGLCRK